jgi:hypothetical protein
VSERFLVGLNLKLHWLPSDKQVGCRCEHTLPHRCSVNNRFPRVSIMAAIRHKCFISYHHADQAYVDQFVRTFDRYGDVFIARGLGQGMSQDVINSNDTQYVMRRIREMFLGDSTVTLVLIGKCTWARRYVDWEIQASLRSGDTVTPNGLLGIKLPTYPAQGGIFPNRLNLNLMSTEDEQAGRDCFARTMPYPSSSDSLSQAIDNAFRRRSTHAKWIRNPRDRFTNNRQC